MSAQVKSDQLKSDKVSTYFSVLISSEIIVTYVCICVKILVFYRKKYVGIFSLLLTVFRLTCVFAKVCDRPQKSANVCLRTVCLRTVVDHRWLRLSAKVRESPVMSGGLVEIFQSAKVQDCLRSSTKNWKKSVAEYRGFFPVHECPQSSTKNWKKSAVDYRGHMPTFADVL